MNRNIKLLLRVLIVGIPTKIVYETIKHTLNCTIKDCEICKGAYVVTFVFALIIGFVFIFYIVGNWEEIWNDE